MDRKNKLTYWFDNKMSEGTVALVKLLSIVTVVLVIGIGVVIAILGMHAGISMGSGIWLSLTHMIDPGTITADDPSQVLFILGMLVVTFIGILITSTLTGIICNVIDEKVQDLRKGRSVVVEKGHVIILGTAGGLYTIIPELIEANANHKHEAIVIMDSKESKDIMDEKINERFPDKKTTKIVCRCGNITDKTDLRVCSFDTCKSVIINTDTDETTLKSILVVTRLLKEYKNDQAYTVAVIRDEQNREAAELAGEGYVEVLSYQDAMSRIIAHTGRYAGLSQVYTDLFDMDGSEFYIEDHPEAVGKTISELNRSFPFSTIVGFVRRNDEVLLNPEIDRKLEPGEKLIIFAEDDEESEMSSTPAPVVEKRILSEYKEEEPQKTNMLVLGYSPKLVKVLKEEDEYVATGSKITIALPSEQIEHKEEFERLMFQHIETEIVETDIYEQQKLEALLEPRMNILVLADDEGSLDEEELESKDSKILMLLLQLRYLSEQKGYKLHITSEMLRPENQEMAEFVNVTDFVVSSNITSLMVTQISQNRELKRIFAELLCAEGSELYVRPAKNYIVTGKKTDIFTAGEAAARQQEILIGYRKQNMETGDIEIVTNPPKSQEVLFEDSDSFIVISMD